MYNKTVGCEPPAWCLIFNPF